jgi:hypothetical protein
MQAKLGTYTNVWAHSAMVLDFVEDVPVRGLINGGFLGHCHKALYLCPRPPDELERRSVVSSWCRLAAVRRLAEGDSFPGACKKRAIK